MNAKEISDVIARLRRQGRDDCAIEVKEAGGGLPKDIWESVSAFANTEGGLILLGLSEANGFSPVPGFAPDRVCDQFVAGMGDGGAPGKLVNPPHYKIERLEVDAQPVLAIWIEELPPASKPCYLLERGAAKGSYKRVDDKDILLSSSELFSVSTASAVDNFDREAVSGATEQDLNSELLARTFDRAMSLAPRAMKDARDDQTKLRRLNFVDETGSVTKAGLLTAGVYPQQFYPRLVVDVAVHAGTQKGEQDALRFADRSICEGTVGEMVVDTMTAVAKNLRRRSVVVGASRVDELEIPEEVIREAVANALIHRDYSPRYDGQSISVDIFDDRVEIVNPGGLYGSKTRANLDDGLSCCRNATLMKLMSLVPLPDAAGSPAEGNGSGIPMMIRMCTERGLTAPVFLPRFDSFKVVLQRPLEDTVQPAPIVSDTASALLDFMTRGTEYSVKELSQASGLTLAQVRYRLRNLLEEGVIVATAPETSRLRKYRLC